MAREDLHFRLRIPENLKARIEAAAELSRRSMTAEIVARLENSFEVDDTLADPARSHETFAPIIETMKSEVSERYERRIRSIEGIVESLADVLSKGVLSPDEQKEIGGVLSGKKGKGNDVGT